MFGLVRVMAKVRVKVRFRVQKELGFDLTYDVSPYGAGGTSSLKVLIRDVRAVYMVDIPNFYHQ